MCMQPLAAGTPGDNGSNTVHSEQLPHQLFLMPTLLDVDLLPTVIVSVVINSLVDRIELHNITLHSILML